MKILAAQLILGSVLSAVVATAAHAQAYPSRPITTIIPFAGGSASDVVSRIMLERMSKSLGQPIIVENRPGASATIGGSAVHQSPPDGYTLLFVPITHVMANVVLKSVPYDAVNDFAGGARRRRPAAGCHVTQDATEDAGRGRNSSARTPG